MTALFQGQSFIQDDGRCLASVDPTPISHYHNGIPVDANGLLCIIGSTEPIVHYHQGLPFSAAGRIVVKNGTPDFYSGGASGYTSPNGEVAHFGSEVPTIQVFANGVGYVNSTGQTNKIAIFVVP
jgi:hypothetical protein